MVLKPPENENYAAVVVEIKNVVKLPGLDSLVAAPLLGYQALISKDTPIGTVGVLFVAETQLSEEYARLNNLHRHSNLNEDQSVKGYLEDNRRVRAIKFRGHRSDALFMPLASLDYAWSGSITLPLGSSFDELNGHSICKKYVRPTKGQGLSAAWIEKSTRVDAKFLPEHFETSNYFRNTHLLYDGELIYITQKLHGTSIRVGHTVVRRKLKWYERLAKKLGVKVQETEYDYVFGSRKVIKDPNNPEQNHFYGTDLWSEEGKKLESLLPKGFVVYGELIGWAEHDKPIQKRYTYGLPPGERKLFVYRVTYINPDGQQYDLSWTQVKEFCFHNGLDCVPELATEFWYEEYDISVWLDRRFADTYVRKFVLPVAEGMVDEGVCIRRDGIKPLILKAKSPIFLQFESKMLDKEVEDIEQQ